MNDNFIRMFNVESLDVEYRNNLNFIDEKKILERIWNKDGSLWKINDDVASNSLGCLNLPEQSKFLSENSISFISALCDKYESICLVGMGGSILGAKAIIDCLGQDASKNFIIGDSTLPSSIDLFQKIVESRKTLFVIASKSGTTLETMMIYEHLKKITGSGVHENLFVAITDSDTNLGEIAFHDKFQKTFFGLTDVGGRYSVLSYFGLLPAALMGCDTSLISQASINMKKELESSEMGNCNLASTIASLLGACSLNGVDKLTFIMPQKLNSFGSWLEQLVAESIGKDNIGLVPITNEPFLETDSYLKDRIFIYFRSGDKENVVQDLHVKKLIDAKFPVLWIEIEEFHFVGGQFFLWQMVIAILGALLKINPFDQPDVEKTKVSVNRILNKTKENLKFDYCDDLNIIKSTLSSINSKSYVALLAFITEDNKQIEHLEKLRKKIGDKYKLATTLGIGPGYLHSNGQMYKGGLKPAHSIFLVNNGTTFNANQDYSKFAQITEAQVFSEIEIFKNLGVQSTCLDISERSKFRIIDLVEAI